jgi:hypothetical protein
MADSASFDFSELSKLAADLGHVSSNAGPFLRSALERTSRSTKQTAQESVKNDNKSRRWKALPGAIGYDITAKAGAGGSSLEAEIGYNKSRYGDRAKLGNLREYGAPGADGVPLAPHNDLVNALHANEADFVKGIAEALNDAQKAVGL